VTAADGPRSESDSRPQPARDREVAEIHDALIKGLSECTALTEINMVSGGHACSEEFGSRLVRAVPRLRALRVFRTDIDSLFFLRHAPNLVELELAKCTFVRSGHIMALGAWAPQLERLRVEECAGLQLDEDEQRLLTPPNALQLPHLKEFRYVPHKRSQMQPILHLLAFGGQ
jgi:hypothetical protein